MATQLGDARSGKLPDSMVAFGRALRRAGVAVDSARMVLAQEAAMAVGVASRTDFGAALEAVMVNRAQDREVFRELFDVWFRDPEVAQKLLAQMLPRTPGQAEPSKRRPRVREALAPPALPGVPPRPDGSDQKLDVDAAMTASDVQRLKHADFNALSASEYRLVERLARDMALPLPEFTSRRTRPGVRGARVHWPGALHQAMRTGGELLQLPRLARRHQPVPLLVLVDVSGSMERYARLLLAFLHSATRHQARREVFAFGTGLTDLGPAFREADSDAMLAQAGQLISDFAGGTRLDVALAALRTQHARRLVGRRTLVLLVTDGLDTGEPGDLAREVGWLKRHTGRLLWLNPLLRYEGYAPLARGAAVLHQQSDGMLAVHNLARLEDLAASLAALVKQSRQH